MKKDKRWLLIWSGQTKGEKLVSTATVLSLGFVGAAIGTTAKKYMVPVLIFIALVAGAGLFIWKKRKAA